MNTKLRNVPFSPPDMSEAEIEQVAEALRSGWITTGPKTKEFERQIAAYVGVNKAVCLNSATAAMEMALRLVGVGPDDEVIVPAYTYTASASAAIHCGAKVIFVDIQKDGTTCFDELRGIAETLAPEYADRIRLHDSAAPLFDLYRVDAQLDKALQKYVWLKSGGSLVIKKEG